MNPTVEEMKNSTLDLVVAGTADAVLMVESEAQELSEDTMLKAVMAGHAAFQPVLQAIIRLAEKAAKEPRELNAKDLGGRKSGHGSGRSRSSRRLSLTQKQERYAAVDALRRRCFRACAEGAEAKFPLEEVAKAFHDAQAKVVRWNILDHKRRIDGRDLTTVRPILAQVGVLPRTHGSALFTRGETQALAVATLGTGEDEQYVNSLDGTYKERFLLHYNFPPYSVGETGRMGSPGRREIGHGKLAWRAIHPMLPTAAEFPYTIRVVSEITEFERVVVDGHGLRLVAGADGCRRAAQAPDRGHRDGPHSRGLALRRAQRHSRRRGPSRRHGFQGRRHGEGVTSLQMDIKIAGITEEIMGQALAQARDGRMHILGEMSKAITGARAELGEFAPRIETMKIPTDKIREVIGTGGKVIREIVEKTGAKINIEDDGTVKIASSDGAKIKAAVNWIKSIASEPEVGQIYDGTVVKTVEFGAFVNFFGSKDGLVHISQLAKARVNKTTDVVKEGDRVKVKVLGHDDRGKVKLSMRVVDQQTGATSKRRPLRSRPRPPNSGSHSRQQGSGASPAPRFASRRGAMLGALRKPERISKP